MNIRGADFVYYQSNNMEKAVALAVEDVEETAKELRRRV
jgi:hypothetical protein